MVSGASEIEGISEASTASEASTSWCISSGGLTGESGGDDSAKGLTGSPEI